MLGRGEQPIISLHIRPEELGQSTSHLLKTVSLWAWTYSKTPVRKI